MNQHTGKDNAQYIAGFKAGYAKSRASLDTPARAELERKAAALDEIQEAYSNYTSMPGGSPRAVYEILERVYAEGRGNQ